MDKPKKPTREKAAKRPAKRKKESLAAFDQRLGVWKKSEEAKDRELVSNMAEYKRELAKYEKLVAEVKEKQEYKPLKASDAESKAKATKGRKKTPRR